MKENWYALFLAIVSNKTVYSSLGCLGKRHKQSPQKKLDLSNSDIEVLNYLKKECTWRELSETLDVDPSYLCSYIKKRTTRELAKASLVANLKNNSISL